MRLVHFPRGKNVIQFICMIAIAVTTMFHVDSSLASTGLDGAASFAVSDDGGQDDASKTVTDLCNFCSCTATFADLQTLSSVPPGQSVPSGRTRSLIAFLHPATAPPPKS